MEKNIGNRVMALLLALTSLLAGFGSFAPAYAAAPTTGLKPMNGAAYAYFRPVIPALTSSLRVGQVREYDLMVHSGDHYVAAQQSYWVFSYDTLQNVDASYQPSQVVEPNLNYLDFWLQNETCNGPAPCTFRGMQVPAGWAAYASGALSNPDPTGDFPVARVRLLATNPGTGTLHWQFNPPDPPNRDSFVCDGAAQRISDNGLYADIQIQITP